MRILSEHSDTEWSKLPGDNLAQLGFSSLSTALLSTCYLELELYTLFLWLEVGEILLIPYFQ